MKLSMYILYIFWAIKLIRLIAWGPLATEEINCFVLNFQVDFGSKEVRFKDLWELITIKEVQFKDLLKIVAVKEVQFKDLRELVAVKEARFKDLWKLVAVKEFQFKGWWDLIVGIGVQFKDWGAFGLINQYLKFTVEEVQ